MFSPALDLEKTAFLTIKTARTRNGSSGRLLSQDFRFFRLLTVRRGEMQTVGKYHFEQLVAECFCAAVIEKQLRNDGLSVPLCRDDIVGVCSAIGGSFLRAQKRDSRSPENPSWLSVFCFTVRVLLRRACAFLLAPYSRALIRSYSPPAFQRLRARYSLEYCRW